MTAALAFLVIGFPSANPLDAVRAFEGSWVGTSEGESGKASVTRIYEPVFGGKFIRFETAATFPPKNGKAGEVHRDIGFFSVHSGAKALALREFHIEGFVNTYRQEKSAGGSLIFVTRDIENIGPGWKAKVTLTPKTANELEEKFELAEPGKAFVVYSRAKLKRKSK